jgi:hypothetical protein
MMKMNLNKAIRNLSNVALCVSCLAYGQNTFADPLNDGLSAYMVCFQQSNSAAPEADTAVHRETCKESYDALNALFPEEIAMVIIEQAELDASQ